MFNDLESFYLFDPLFLATDELRGGGDKDEDPEWCLAWLDERRLVAYVSFGT